MSTDRVQSVDRAFSLLEHLADGGGSLSLSELGTRSGLPMPTIHRLMRSLVSQGYVRQEPSRRYAIGPRMIRLGESASRMLGSWATAASGPAGRPVRRDHQHGHARRRLGGLCGPGPLPAVDADVHRGRPDGDAAQHRRRQGDLVHARRRRGPRHRQAYRDARRAPSTPSPLQTACLRRWARSASGVRHRRRRTRARRTLHRGTDQRAAVSGCLVGVGSRQPGDGRSDRGDGAGDGEGGQPVA